MYILSEYYLYPGSSESHKVFVFNDFDDAKRGFHRLAEETRLIFPDLDEDETNAHWEDASGGEPHVYDLALIDVGGKFVDD